jgi:nucleotide-binding universal stress UspA family protein
MVVRGVEALRRPSAPEQDAASDGGVLLASEGRAIPPAAIELAARLAQDHGGRVHVFSVVRVWGSGFGFPNPGLLPNKGEWEAQRVVVADAVNALGKRGVDASAQVLATRKATKRILAHAARLHCGAIVMAADAPRNRFLADMMWSQEPYRVKRRAKVPVHLVTG